MCGVKSFYFIANQKAIFMWWTWLWLWTSAHLKRTCVLSQVPQGPGRQSAPLLLKACFHLSLIYLCDITDWKEITCRKLGYRSYSPNPAPSVQSDDYWQVLGACREGWTNAFLQMTARQGKIEFSHSSFCVCGGGETGESPRNRQW